MAEQEQELGLCFQRRFLAARQLRAFPWPELEQRLRSAPGSSLLADILHQVRAGLSRLSNMIDLPPLTLVNFNWKYYPSQEG
uniref:FAM86 N-terminal domain-containing protein n=1 Tax=Anas platyrhynchos platyrhynchos TaxID=8840 RepID=A0A493TM68_ANAPP